MFCITKRSRRRTLLTFPSVARLCLPLALAAAAGGQALTSVTAPATDSRFEVYGGYGFLYPEHSDIRGLAFPELYNPNATVNATYFFSRHFGAQVEGSYFSLGPTLDASGQCNAVPCSPAGQKVYTAQAGPVFRYPIGRYIPFAHLLGGGEKVNGPYYNPLKWGYGITGGVGLDYVLPYFHNRLAVRPIQADFQYSQTQFGPVVEPAETSGGLATIKAAKLSGGLVIRLGARDMDTGSHGGLMLDCNASPASLYPGDPVSISTSPMNLNPRKLYHYQWSSFGGKLTQTGDGAQIATAGMVPGDYVVNGTLSQGHQQAQCQTKFTVRPFEPPTLSCHANPGSVQSGGVATILADGVSPSSRELFYTFTTDAGQLAPIGNKAQLLTAGLSATTIHVTCNVADDLGRSATASTIVNVTTQRTAMPPLADTQALCGVSFERDRRRPVRVDNEAKACLDDIALNLAREPAAKLIIVGDSAPGERPVSGEQRSLNVREYLTREKGVDSGRIELRYGGASGRSVENILVPPGTSYNNPGTTVFDPASITRVGQPYGMASPARPRAHHHAVARYRAVTRHRRRAGHRQRRRPAKSD